MADPVNYLSSGLFAPDPVRMNALMPSSGATGEMRAWAPRDPSEALPPIIGNALARFLGVDERTAMDYGHRLTGLAGDLFPMASAAGHIGARTGEAYANGGVGTAAGQAALYGLPAAALYGMSRAFMPGNRDAGLAALYENMPGKSITGFSRGNPAEGSILDRSFYLSTEPGMVSARKQAERYGEFRSPYRDDPGIPLFHDNDVSGFAPRIVK